MNTRRIRFGEASLVHAERRMLGKSLEFICGWSGKAFGVKLALITFIGLSILLVPLSSLTFTSALRWRLIEPSLLAARGTSSILGSCHPFATRVLLSILKWRQWRHIVAPNYRGWQSVHCFLELNYSLSLADRKL